MQTPLHGDSTHRLLGTSFHQNIAALILLNSGTFTLPDTGRVRIGRGRAGKKIKEGGMSHQSRQIASKTLKLS